jgi:hypothetical protein
LVTWTMLGVINRCYLPYALLGSGVSFSWLHGAYGVVVKIGYVLKHKITW